MKFIFFAQFIAFCCHGDFVCVKAEMNCKNFPISILNSIPKPWTFHSLKSNTLIYIPSENCDDLIEMLSTYGLECWRIYA